MPIDPSISLQGQMPDIAGIYANTLRARQQNVMAAQQAQEAEMNQLRNASKLRAYQQSVDPATGQVNRNALLKNLTMGGNADLVPALQSEFSKQDEAEFKAKQEKLKFDIDSTRNAREEVARATGKNDAISIARKFVAQGVLDPDTANSIVSAIPDDPKGFENWRRTFTMQLLDGEKRLDAEYKQGMLGVARTNAITSQGQLNVARGNLGVARQRLALDAFKATQPAQPTAAQTATQQKIQKGQGNVSSLVGKLRGYYDELEKRGGAVREGGGLANVPSYLAGTFGFREVPQALGTQASSTRDKIKSARRALVQEIKNATGMSAQEMNSNAELQGLLDSATDPTQPLEAVYETLGTIESLYGRGGAPAPAATPKSTTNIDALLEKYR